LNVLALLKAFAFVGFDLSRRYCGRGVVEGSAGAEDLRKNKELALLRARPFEECTVMIQES